MKAYLGPPPPPTPPKKKIHIPYTVYTVYFCLSVCSIIIISLQVQLHFFYVDRTKDNIIYAHTTLQLGARNFQLLKTYTIM